MISSSCTKWTSLQLTYHQYPSLPVSSLGGHEPSTDIRAGAHTDYGSITLLFRLPGQPGLEVQDSDGNWVAVPVEPEGGTTQSLSSVSEPVSHLPILVNIGDLLSYWTNGLLRSTMHRVIFPVASNGSTSTERYSIAYFCHPLDEARLEAVPSPIVRKVAAEESKGSDENGPALGNGSERGVMTAKEHLMSRLAATYGGAT